MARQYYLVLRPMPITTCLLDHFTTKQVVVIGPTR
jgi:hypothetical protein